MEKDAFAVRSAAILRAAFPVGTDIRIVPGHDLIFAIDWPLNAGLNRPNKRSRIINPILPYEAIEDCSELGRAERNLKEFVQARLIHFDPQHEHPKHVSPPVEEWLVSPPSQREACIVSARSAALTSTGRMNQQLTAFTHLLFSEVHTQTLRSARTSSLPGCLKSADQRSMIPSSIILLLYNSLRVSHNRSTNCLFGLSNLTMIPLWRVRGGVPKGTQCNSFKRLLVM